MLPKKRRIARKDFSSIVGSGKRLHSPLFLLNVAKNKADYDSQVSFSASKKVAKNAVDRNKLRRRGYSAIEKYIGNMKPGFFLHFTYKKTLKVPKIDEIENDLFELLSKSSVLE